MSELHPYGLLESPFMGTGFRTSRSPAISHDMSVKPKYSNDLLERGFERVTGPTLTGYVDTFPRILRRGSPSPLRVAALYTKRK